MSTRYPKRGLDRFNTLSCLLFAAIGGLLYWLATLDTDIAPKSIIPLSFYGWIIGLMQIMWMALTLFRLDVDFDYCPAFFVVKFFVGVVHLVFFGIYYEEPIQPNWFLLWLAIMAWIDAATIAAVAKLRELKLILSGTGPAFEKDVL